MKMKFIFLHGSMCYFNIDILELVLNMKPDICINEEKEENYHRIENEKKE